MVKNPSDFLGAYLGESEKKTVAILDAAVGCVLVIDEAYGLHAKNMTDPFKVSGHISVCLLSSLVVVCVRHS